VIFLYLFSSAVEALGSIVGREAMLQARRLWVRVPMSELILLLFFYLSKTSITMAPGLTQTVTEISTRKCFRGVKVV
jgi:hypothetical protein